MDCSSVHVPVLFREALEMLDVKKSGIYIDATVGLGGHSAGILSAAGQSATLLGIDRDDAALAKASERLADKRAVLRKGSFGDLAEIASEEGISSVDGILFDLGTSMLQMKDMQRGFSFMSDERLDMRMDADQRLTAWDVINRYTQEELERVIREYGEEPFARRIARAVVSARKIKSIDTCSELGSLIQKACGRHGKTHPATRTFQALRIEVNRELEQLRKGLAESIGLLKHGGRLCVISYHSLEDRIVKNFLRDSAREGRLKVLTKKPLVPQRDEVRQNPSSRSAKMRGAEKI
ncbi:MAG: 16S rRNA (cytosine(1402)-N(4))-methyltransferase RsmH [Nitrospiraceae bacterium]|nr:16S rRNA (cytosine(1402)-N(4))-methyltransferase RsmH [Nitrospiraceae bacterium]